MKKFKFDLSFISPSDTCIECCPMCASENDISCDGKGKCTVCGHKNMLPCSACHEVNEYEGGIQVRDACDWSKDNGCTPFQKKVSHGR